MVGIPLALARVMVALWKSVMRPMAIISRSEISIWPDVGVMVLVWLGLEVAVERPAFVGADGFDETLGHLVGEPPLAEKVVGPFEESCEVWDSGEFDGS